MPGAQELLVIVVVALLVFGPDRLPEIARTAARTIARLRGEAQRNVAELRRLADMEDLEAELRRARSDLDALSEQAGLSPSQRHRGRPVGRGPKALAAPARAIGSTVHDLSGAAGAARSASAASAASDTTRTSDDATAPTSGRNPMESGVPSRGADDPPPFDTEAT